MHKVTPNVTQAPMPTHREALQAFLSYLTLPRIGVTVLLSLLAALILDPIFITPLSEMMGRTLFVGSTVLVAFAAAGQWPRRLPSWLQRWFLQVLVVGLTVPLATLIVYLIVVKGDLARLLASQGRILGFMWIAGAGLFVGPLLAMGALYRQRDSEARSQALRFELERSELERRALDTRLRLLQAQIEPHFLFNTLANVRTLVETGSPQAAPVLRSLIAYLRAAMPRLHADAACLADELSLVRAYLELMHLRMPDRLSFSVEVPADIQRLRFPPMALLTLVENAVRHGIDPSEEGGRIEVGGQVEGPQGPVRLWVKDTGVGMTSQMGTGTGLRNLQERLKVSYGATACLELRELQPHGVHAEIQFPLEDE